MADRENLVGGPAGESSRRLAFRAVHVDPTVLAYLGRVPETIARCLEGVFVQIREKRLRMLPAGEPGLFVTSACSHVITASVTRDRQVVVIVGAIYDPQGQER